MGIVIAGHQRSGTSLLGRILDSQPDISITGEFGCYMHLDIPLAEHRTLILKRWIAKETVPSSAAGGGNPLK